MFRSALRTIAVGTSALALGACATVGILSLADKLENGRTDEQQEEQSLTAEQNFSPFSSVQARGGKELVASFGASGFIFKDTAEVTAFDDPAVEGITVYISNMKDGRLKVGLIYLDSLRQCTCLNSGSKTLPPRLCAWFKQDPFGITEGTSGENIFSESRNMFFKSVKVRRVYDESRNALVYVAYSTRFYSNDNDRYIEVSYGLFSSVDNLPAEQK